MCSTSSRQGCLEPDVHATGVSAVHGVRHESHVRVFHRNRVGRSVGRRVVHDNDRQWLVLQTTKGVQAGKRVVPTVPRKDDDGDVRGLGH